MPSLSPHFHARGPDAGVRPRPGCGRRPAGSGRRPALRAGILNPGKSLRYHATTVGERTAVLAVDARSGELAGKVSLPGRLAIPAVAVDGTPSGLAADGSRLITIRPRERFPRRQTELAIFEVRQARDIRPDPVRPRITLEGDFSFDAISPDGDTIYPAEFRDRRDPTEYQVRALDIATAELDPEPILDPARNRAR